jgi:UDP-N-acetyl-D-glucosamine dehydrogenase
MIVIAVPTPLTIDRQPDLSFIEAAIETIASVIKHEILIINESTSYPGTLRKVIAEKIFSISGIKHRYAAAPERIDPGNNYWNISNTPRIISGLDDETTKEAEEFYLTFTKSVKTFSTPEVVEMSKLVENSFRQVNIAFVNELAQIANVFGVSINEVLSAADTKPHGYMKFTPGAGVGGHCIPVDPTYLFFEAKRLGVNSLFIEYANKVNQEMPAYIVSRILKDNNNNLTNKKIIVIGVAYKANVSDTRETPALKVINLLIKENAQVYWHDPLVDKFCDQESQEIKDQDIAVVLTLHELIDIEKIKKIKYVFDCTNKLDWAESL